MANVLGVCHVASDIDKLTHFFRSVLEFTKVDIHQSKDQTLVKLQLGHEFNYLMQYSGGHGRPFPKDTHGNDLWFQHIAIVVSDMDKAYDKLMHHGLQPISASPQTLPEWNIAAAGIKAFYFRSPEGHPLELIWFPSGKGNPIWQTKKSLFLGINHTAITVANTDVSSKFYEELGMKVVGGSLNHGETQEKLSGVPGAKVKITTVSYPQPHSMGVEFLEYLNPLGGRKKPEDTQLHDLSEVRTIIEVTNLQTLTNQLRSWAMEPIGKEVLDSLGGYSKGVIIADPDGHLVLLVEKS